MRDTRGSAMRLADEFFLLAHDHEGARTRARLLPVVLGIGTASALLAELMMDGLVGQLDGYILGARPIQMSRGGAPRDEVTARVVRAIRSGAGQQVPYWLGELRHFAADGVRDRLLDDGVLREARARRWWGGSSVSFEAVDENFALNTEARLYSLLGEHGPAADIDLQVATLAALAEVTGLVGKITLWDSSIAAVRARAATMRAELPEPLGGLLSHTETAVGAAMLSSRHH